MPPLPINHRVTPALVRMPQAPAVFGISRSALYRAAGEGKIVVKKVGRSSYVETASALAYIDSLPAATIRSERKAI